MTDQTQSSITGALANALMMAHMGKAPTYGAGYPEWQPQPSGTLSDSANGVTGPTLPTEPNIDTDIMNRLGFNAAMRNARGGWGI